MIKIVLTFLMVAGSFQSCLAVPDQAKCDALIQKCGNVEIILDLLPNALTPYLNCLRSNVAVIGKCAGPLNEFISQWNQFVDLCQACVSEESPLQGCSDIDQNFVCPQKMSLVK